MKNYLLLLILPVIFTVYSFALKNADSPNYNYGMADPSYVYLLNSLTMSNLEGAGHIDHPGTPLQVTGAVILKIYYSFSHVKENISEDVIYRAEDYLRVFDHTLILLNAAGLFISGLLIFFVFKNIPAGMIFQTIPFISINVLEVFSLIKTENFAFFLILIQIVIVVKYVYDPGSSGKKSYVYISGILCGIILAVKVSFLCIALLPIMIFSGNRDRLILILIMFLTFCISVIPVISGMSYFFGWITNLVLHNGRYGSGESTIVNSHEFFRNILKIFTNEKFFVFTYFFLLTLIVFFVLKRKNIREIISSKEIRLCAAMFISLNIHILMVAKHYSSRYMFPALILTVPALFISSYIFYRIYFSKLKLNFLFAGLLIFLLLFGAYIGRKQLAKSHFISSESKKLNNFLLSNYNNETAVLSSGVSNQCAAFIFSYYYTPVNSRPRLKKIISQRFPGAVWYDVFNESLIPFSEREINKSLNKDNGFQNRPELYITTDENYNDGFIRNYKKLYNSNSVTLSKIFSNDNGEKIYRVEDH